MIKNNDIEKTVSKINKSKNFYLINLLNYTKEDSKPLYNFNNVKNML